MAFTLKQMSCIVAFLGILSFVFGIIAENKKPAAGTPFPMKDYVLCKYPSSLTVPMGYLSIAFSVAATVVGYMSLFYPYKGKSIPQGKFFQDMRFSAFFTSALFCAGLGLTLLLWPTLSEQHLQKNNRYEGQDAACPTAKTGHFGGGAFLSLDTSLLWLVALMLADNVREDYLEDLDEKASRHSAPGLEMVDL